MPTTVTGKAIASRNATTHGLFARDVVLPSLGEDPEGYRQLEAEWMAQLPPRTLLERHYVEKIAAASWRLRRLHRWQAQLFEDNTLSECERLDRLDRAMRHETALHRQIDTAVKMLNKDAPQLFAQRVRDQVLEDIQVSERECREDAEDDRAVAMETRNRLRRIRKATMQAVNELSVAPLDTCPEEICENELPPVEAAESFSLCPRTPDPEGTGNVGAPLAAPFLKGRGRELKDPAEAAAPAGNERPEDEQGEHDSSIKKCENEPVPFHWDPRRVTEYLNPNHQADGIRACTRRALHRKVLQT